MAARTEGRHCRAAPRGALVCLAALTLFDCASADGAARRGRGRPAIVESADGEQPGRQSPGAPPSGEGNGAAGGREPAGRLDIRLDLTVIETLLAMRDRGAADEAEIDRWVRLQGNRELRRQGRLRADLTPSTLKDAARLAIRGESTPGPASVGPAGAEDFDVLRALAGSIDARREALAGAASQALLPYLPEGRPLPPLTVHFHVGGTWDGRTSDRVYISLTPFQARGVESLPGLDALLAHELFHLAQAVLLGSIEDYSSRQSGLFTVLLRIQQEGMARHIEYAYLQTRFEVSGLDRTNFGKYQEGLRRAREDAGLVGEILDALARGDRDGARALADRGFTLGGPLYSVGHAMARTIDRALGPGALAGTVAAGPIAFYDAYIEALRAGGRRTILPEGLDGRVEELREGYARSWFEASHARREGLRMLLERRGDAAADLLKRAALLDPTDFLSAYNLACVYALDGRKRRAIRWLEAAVERGFENFSHMMDDADLESLREERAFGRLLRDHGIAAPSRTEGGPAEPVNP